MLIKAENISYTYEFGQEAFNSLSFSLKRGEILCLCGANGSGKSSLLQVLAGILEITNGNIEVDNSSKLNDISAILFQEPDIQLLGQTVLEDVLLTSPNPSKEDLERAENFLKSFNLWEKKDDFLDSLSFGQKRKLCFASALMQEPELLLLDEPTAGLDYPAQEQLKKIILDNENKVITQCISTHDIEFCADFANSFLLLEKGRAVFYGDLKGALQHIKENENIGIRLPQIF